MYKLLPSVSKDNNHPQAADELTRYMLTKIHLKYQTIQAAVQGWQRNLKVLNLGFVS